MECNTCHELGNFGRKCRSNTENAKKRRTNLEKTYDDQEESEPEEIQQITQLSKILLDKNDHYRIKLIVKGKYRNFTIDTGSPITIMPNIPTLYKPKDIEQLKERYKNVHKNEIKLLDKVWADIDYNGEITKLPILTKGSDITPLLGVNLLKQLPITVNNILLDERTNQSKIVHSKFNEPHNQEHRSKYPNKTRMLANQTESKYQTTYIKTLNRKFGTPGKVRNHR